MPRTTSAADRARRLIALLGKLHDGARLSIEGLAEELGVTTRDLASDLDALSMCGVAPYDPGTLVPIIVEDGFVEVFGDLPAVKGAIRLSPAEATALASALQTAGFSASDPLTTRLLEASSAGFDAGELERMVRTAIASHQPEVYESLAAAIRDRRIVEIEYAAIGDESASCREVEPASLFAERGAWYLQAWCRTAGDWRTFRIDRIRSANVTRETFEPRDAAPAAVAFRDEGSLTARLRFAPDEQFTEREWPGARIAEQCTDGSLLVEVPFMGTAWIARRVAARLGAVEVIEPQQVRAAVREIARGIGSA